MSALDLPRAGQANASLGKPVATAALAGRWELRETAPGAVASPDRLPDDAAWMPAQVPGTVAQALQRAGQWRDDAPPALHERDYWYRVPLHGSGPHRLRLQGLATVAEVWLDRDRLLQTQNMFTSHEADVWLRGDHHLYLCFRSLHQWLRGQRGPARWKPRMISPPSLRFARTTLLGHMPGWCPPVHAVGPWREVELLALGGAGSALRTARFELDGRLDGDDGVIALWLRGIDALPDGMVPLLRAHDREATLVPTADGGWSATLRLSKVRKWWPHTHGEPALYAVTLQLGDEAVGCGNVGFRRIEVDTGTAASGSADEAPPGFALRVNGVPVFCRGACVASLDLAGHTPSARQCERWVGLAREAGMNMLRVSGVTCYQSEAFYAACDAAGILVWQDFMFANFDYPVDAATNAAADAATGAATGAATAAAASWTAQARREVCEWLAATRQHPSIAVLCGGSEVEQQAAMMGVPAAGWRHALFDTVIPQCIARHRPAAVYVRNSPSGGAWPFVPEAGVTHYYGVGAYQRPLVDARRADVRFAAECLAFANVPCARTLRDTLPVPAVHDPRWKARVPRDAGSAWDFEDVRDFYLREVFGVDPAQLRYEDMARYLQLSRAVVAEAMTDVFAEWRRAGSRCAGGLVWQMQDLLPGAGWGIIDALGRPKSAWHALRAVWRPLQVLLTDEGLNGVHVHLINETAHERPVQLRLQCLRDGEAALVDVVRALVLPPRSARRLSGPALAGVFFDFTDAYRFGPRMHDVVRATLSDPADGAMLSEACYLPDRRACALQPPELSATVERLAGQWWLTVSARRFARWVHVDDAAFRAESDWFHLGPGSSRHIRLLPDPSHEGLDRSPQQAIPMGEVYALNARRPTAYAA